MPTITADTATRIVYKAIPIFFRGDVLFLESRDRGGDVRGKMITPIPGYLFSIATSTTFGKCKWIVYQKIRYFLVRDWKMVAFLVILAWREKFLVLVGGVGSRFLI